MAAILAKVVQSLAPAPCSPVRRGNNETQPQEGDADPVMMSERVPPYDPGPAWPSADSASWCPQWLALP
eukprot:scaffold70578_cov34-Tisochrysis_lutea.AAC.2